MASMSIAGAPAARSRFYTSVYHYNRQSAMVISVIIAGLSACRQIIAGTFKKDPNELCIFSVFVV